MSATPARTLLFARIAHRGVTARAARRVFVRATASPRCRGDRVGPPVSGPPPSTTARSALSGSRAFVSAHAPRSGNWTARAVPSLRRRVAALRAAVSAAGDALDPAAAEVLQGSVETETEKTSSASRSASRSRAQGSHQLITFFKFTLVPDYERELEDHRAFIAENGLEIRGRIYINAQGVNAQMSGRGTDGEKYARWVESREHFNGMRISIYPVDAHAHPKLSLRYKPMLVQLEGGTAHLPVHDPSQRGVPLNPSEWHDMLGEVLANAPGAPLLLDVRNGYEWDVGHFRGASRPVQESFRETVDTNVFAAAVEEGLEDVRRPRGPLAGVDKKKPIMMYCTGGIRCDVYSAVLKKQGYENVYTLEGGVQAYFDAFGTREDQRWDDQLFVFDSRLAMTPTGAPALESPDATATLECHCCKEKRAKAPHRNCPNVDCNRLFLVCAGCIRAKGGFCCAACGKASHVRPRFVQPGRYQRYAHYAEGDAISRSERRGDGRKERRRRRRERKKTETAAKNAEAIASGRKPRDLFRAARVLEKAARDPKGFAAARAGASGTFAARAGRIAEAAGLLDSDPFDSGNAATGLYAEQRRKVREAANGILVSGETLGMRSRLSEDDAGDVSSRAETKDDRRPGDAPVAPEKRSGA